MNAARIAASFSGVSSFGPSAFFGPCLGEPAAVLGPRYGEVADVQAIVPFYPRPDFRVGSAFRLQIRFALVVVYVGYEDEHVAVHGYAGLGKTGIRIPFVWHITRRLIQSNAFGQNGAFCFVSTGQMGQGGYVTDHPVVSSGYIPLPRTPASARVSFRHYPKAMRKTPGSAHSLPAGHPVLRQNMRSGNL